MKSLLLVFLVRILALPGAEPNAESPGLITIDFPETKAEVSFNLADRLRVFQPLSPSAVYFITLCADIPDNNNPSKVHVGQQPGHVFVILEKRDLKVPGSTVTVVFGFYPIRKRSSILSGNIPGKISDNSGREYNASISKQLSPHEFHLVLQHSQQLASRKYNLRNFNCYDYVIAIFNSIAGNDTLPVNRVRLPLLLGHAGSPCNLYRDLQVWKRCKPQLSSALRFGTFTAPQSSLR